MVLEIEAHNITLHPYFRTGYAKSWCNRQIEYPLYGQISISKLRAVLYFGFQGRTRCVVDPEPTGSPRLP